MNQQSELSQWNKGETNEMREAEEEYCDAGFELQVITYIVYT